MIYNNIRLALFLCTLFLNTKLNNAISADYSVYSQFIWSDLPTEQREYYARIGWTEEKWEEDGYNPDEDDEEEGEEIGLYAVDELSWDDLPEKFKKHFLDNGWTKSVWDKDGDTYSTDWEEQETGSMVALTALGWTQDLWDSANVMTTPAQEKPWRELAHKELEAAKYLGFNNLTWFVKPIDENFNPSVTHLSIPELEKFNLEYFSGLDIPVRLCNGDTLGDDEESKLGKTMRDFVESLKKGSMEYLKYEDGEPLKLAIQAEIGNEVLRHLRTAVSNSHLRESGQYPIVYDEIEFNEYNWVFWLGGKNTSTAMHYDGDSLNFLWVVEGRKRIVILPNDERTHGQYSCISDFGGHSCWTGVDILYGPLPPHAIEVELGPGDGILIPNKAWHAVQNLEATVAFGLRNDLPI